MATMKRFSVLIRWEDGDQEQGEYGWCGKAASEGDAETKAREAMRESHIENYCDGMDDDEIKESCAGYEDADGLFGGSVVEISTGSMWKAQELEDALAGLVEAIDGGKDTAAALKLARETLASLDV